MREQHLRLPVADRVLPQQERHEHDQEARQPSRTAVGAQRVGDVAGDPGTATPARPGLVPRTRGAPGPPRPGWSRPARAAGSRRPWRSRTARTRSAGTTAARPARPAPAIGAESATPTMPAIDTRPLALTSVKLSGSSRGTAAARVTPYALDATRTPSAAGKSPCDSVTTASASTQHRKARRAMVAPIAQRRPWANRSRNGPISGATIANGSIVSAEEERHLAPRLAGGDLEEEGARQRDRHRRVAGGVEDVHLDQPGQARLAGTLGVRRPLGLAHRVAAGPAGRAGGRTESAGHLGTLPGTGRRSGPVAGSGWGSRQRCSSVDESGAGVMSPSCPVVNEDCGATRPDRGCLDGS